MKTAFLQAFILMICITGWVRAQSITVTSPNGGETWSGSSTQNISWTVSSVSSVDIEFTSNNGTTWNTIVLAHPGLSSPYPWLVPSAGPSGSTQCRVRVKSSTNNTVQDESNSNFSIPASVLTLNFPLGGDNLKAGQMRAIRWTPLSVVTVRIEYTTNNGSNWTLVADSVPANRRFFSWVVPNNITSTAKVRVSDRSFSTVNSVSPANFAISALGNPASGKFFGGAYDGYAKDNNLPKTLIVTSPNGGETWSGATTRNVTWNSGNVDNIRIEYSTNNGTNWIVIQASYPANTQSFPWLVPAAGPLGSTQCLVRLTNVLDTTLSDVSNGNFSIPPSTVAVVTPNGGENYKAGTMTSIRWNSTSILTMQLHYSTNNGSSWVLMADSVPAWRTYFGWTIPTGVQSSQCLVRARNKTDTVVVDASNATFTIGASLQPASGKYFGGAYDGYAFDNNLPRILTVLTPNGGENWPGASTQNITWTALNVSTIKIEFTSNNGSTWNTVQNTYPAGTGNFPWLVPGAGPLGSTQCRVRLTDVLDTTRVDESNANFSIPPSSVTVVTPNGGENYKAGTMTSIRWISASILTVQLHYSTNNGSNWILMADSVPAWRTYFGWTIPTGVQSSQCRVRTRDKSDTVVFDISNAAFSIGAQIQSASGKFFGGSYDGYTTDIACPIPVATLSGNSFTCFGQPTTISVFLENSRPWSFQWTDGQTTQTVSSIVTSPYLIQVTPSSTRTYQVTNFTGSCGAGEVTVPFVQSVSPAPTASLSGPSSVCAGNAILLSLNLTGVAPYSVTYTNGITPQTLNGITASPFSFSVTPAQSVTYSLVSISDGCASGSVSGSIPVQVINPPSVVLTGTNTINLNSSTNLQFAFSGTSPWNLAYTDGISIFSASGITSSPYLISVTPLVYTNYSPVSVNNGCSGGVSGSAGITVNSAPTATLSGSANICAGTPVTLSVILGGPAPYSITWTDGVNTTTQHGITSTLYTFSVTPTTSATYTLVSVTNPLVGTVSGTALVSVTPIMNVTLSGNQTITQNQAANLSFALTGNSPWTFSYTNGVNTIPVTGITANPYIVSVTPLQTTTYSLVNMTSACAGSLNGNAVIVVNVPPTAALSGSQSLCAGQSAQLTVQFGGGQGPYDLTWTDGTNNQTQLGITNNPYLINLTPSQSTTYNLVSVSNVIPGTVSGTAIVQVTAVPTTVTSLQAGTAGCTSLSWTWNTVNGATTFYADAASDQNFTSILSGWNNALLGNTTSLTLTGLSPGQTVFVRVRGNNICGTSSNIAGVSHTTQPLPVATTTVGSTAVHCTGFTTNWNATTNATGYELEVSTQSNFSTLLSGYNPMVLSNVTTQSVTGLTENTVYFWRVRGTNTCGNGAVSSGVMIRTSNMADSFIVSSNAPVCSGGTLQLSALGSYTGSSFSWNGPSGYTSMGATALLTNVNMSQSGVYSLFVSANGCSSVTQTATVQINNPVSGLSRGGNKVLCSGETLFMTSSVTGTGVSYLWAGPNGFTYSGSTLTINSITTASSGIYTITVTSPGCNQVSDTIHVSVINTISVSLSNSSPVCEGNVVFMNASHVPGSSYMWSGPMGFTSSAQNPSLTQATPIMSGYYTLTIAQPGCTNPLTYQTQVTVSPAVNSIAITSNSPVCTGGNLGLSVTSLSGALYSWSGPSGFTSVTWNNILSQATTANGGQYSVTVSSPGCTPNTLLFDAVVFPTLNAVAGSNTPVCETGIVMLSAPFYPGATYAWSGPSGFSSQLQNPSLVNVVPQQSGVYSLTVHQPVCGTSSTTVNVTISPNPLFVSRGSNNPICQGGTLQLSSTLVSGLQYLWQGPGGFTSNSASASISGIMVGQAGVYTLTVSSNGCVSLVDFLSVTVNSASPIQAGAVTNPVCSGSSLNLTSNNIPNAMYSWAGPSGFTSNRQDPALSQVNSGNSGVYTLLVTQPGCGVGSSTVSIQVGTSMNTLTASSNSPVCIGGTLVLSSALVPGVNYLWNGPGGFTSTSNLISFPNVTTSRAGNYTLSVSSPGCNGYNFLVKPIVNNTALLSVSSNSPICAGGVLQFAAIGVSGTTYSWTGPDGFNSTQPNPSISNARVINSGVYTLLMSIPNCGVSTLTTSAQVGANLNSANVFTNAPICVGNNLHMSAGTITGATYTWAGPNGFTSGVQFPVLNAAGFSEAGVYSLTISTPGCLAVTRLQTVVINPPLVVLPNSTAPVCQGGVVYFDANSLTGATYFWEGPNSFTSNVQRPSLVNAQPVNSGLYTLTMNTPGCGTAVGTTHVQIGANLSQTILTSNSPVCVGNTLQISSNSLGNGSIQWSAPDGFTSSSQSFNRVNATTGFAGVYSALISSPGCAPLDRTITISVLNPVLSPGSNSPLCQGSVLQLSMNLLNGATYNWSGPMGFISMQQNPSISSATPTRSGVYTVTVTTPACGAMTSTASIVVGSSLGSLSVSGNTPICVGSLLNLSATNRTGFLFAWTGPNGFTSNIAEPIIMSASTLNAGRYTVQITSPGCGNSTLQTAVQVVNNPASVTASATTPVCRGSAIYFNSTAPSGSARSWSGPAGFASTSVSPSRSNAQLTHSGIYTLNATVPGCGVVSTTVTVTVNNCRTGSGTEIEDTNADAATEVKDIVKGDWVFEVYPNPTEGLSRARIRGVGQESCQLQVMDVLGHVVLMQGKESRDAGSIYWDLDFRNLPKGVYLIKVTGEGIEQTDRVIFR